MVRTFACLALLSLFLALPSSADARCGRHPFRNLIKGAAKIVKGTVKVGAAAGHKATHPFGLRCR